MKKISMITIVLLISVAVFASTDASAELVLSTTVADQFGLTIHTGAKPQSLSDFNGLTAAGTSEDPISFDSEDIYDEEERVLTVSAMTNKNSGYKVEVTANPLSSQGASTKIGYLITITDSSDVVVLNTDTNKTFNLMTFTASGGLYFASNDFGITIDLTDWENATAGDYSTQWTVSLTTT